MVGEWELDHSVEIVLIEARSRISSRMEIMIGKAHLLIVTGTTINITAYFEKLSSKISTQVRGVVRSYTKSNVLPTQGKAPGNEAELYRGCPRGTREHGLVYSRQLVL